MWIYAVLKAGKLYSQSLMSIASPNFQTGAEFFLIYFVYLPTWWLRQ